MINILICICVLSFLTLILLCILILKKNNSQKINCLDERAKKVVNTISFISTTFTVLALCISSLGLILQSKSPELQIEIYTARGTTWEEENEGQVLCLSYDVDSHVNFALEPYNTWRLCIKNTGNKFAENVKIQIQLDNCVFITEPDSFTLSSHNYGIGSYNVIEHTFGEIIQPGETVEVPYIPFNNAVVHDDYKVENANMNIKIYENSSLVLEKNVYIEMVDNPMVKDRCYLEVYESEEDKWVRKFNEHYFEQKEYISESNLLLDSLELYPKELAFSLKKHEMVYKHYLKLINVYNSTLVGVYSKLAVFYGRLYYMGLSKDIPGIDIEQAIENDMAIQSK